MAGSSDALTVSERAHFLDSSSSSPQTGLPPRDWLPPPSPNLRQWLTEDARRARHTIGLLLASTPCALFRPISREESMLVLTRKVGERLVIGGTFSITVVAVVGGKVRLGVTAPNEVTVDREEI